MSADNIREQDKFISDDLFEGRYPGLRGGELAAKYIASQFALYGLKAREFDNGTYFQQINFVGMKVVPEKASVLLLVPQKGAPLALKFGDDYTVSNQTLGDFAKIDRPRRLCSSVMAWRTRIRLE